MAIEQWCGAGLPEEQDFNPRARVDADIFEDRPDYRLRKQTRSRLISAREGAVICQFPSVWLIMPRGCSVWFPADRPVTIVETQNCCTEELTIDTTETDFDFDVKSRVTTSIVLALIERLGGGRFDHDITPEVHLLLKVLIQELTLMPTVPFELKFPKSARLRGIAEHLLQSPEDRTTPREWACMLGIAEFAFIRSFVFETGLSFTRWRQQMHLFVAIKNLSEGAPVKYVARILGYRSMGGFIEMFKRTAGVSPGQLGNLQQSFTDWFGH